MPCMFRAWAYLLGTIIGVPGGCAWSARYHCTSAHYPDRFAIQDLCAPRNDCDAVIEAVGKLPYDHCIASAIDGTFPLERIGQARTMGESWRKRGNVMVTM